MSDPVAASAAIVHLQKSLGNVCKAVREATAELRKTHWGDPRIMEIVAKLEKPL